MGLSRRTASYASAKNLLPAADEAVRLSPTDPEAHYLRASMLTSIGETSEGVREYEQAVSFRPLDYVLWLSLGSARDEAGDTEGALLAFREAVRLAPAYAEPRWQLGNLLLRMNQREEAFTELRRATMSEPTLLPNFIDLVWNATSGDTTTLERVIHPETDSWKLALARFLLKRGKTGEALALYRAAGEASAEDRLSLLRELLAAKQFAAAYEVWKSRRVEGGEKSASAEGGGGSTLITDGGFEGGTKVNEPGFGWQLISGQQAVRASLDQGSPRGGAKSLLLDWAGGVDAATPVLSQLVLVEAGARYRLRFFPDNEIVHWRATRHRRLGRWREGGGASALRSPAARNGRVEGRDA
jgi:hypothetical protein